VPLFRLAVATLVLLAAMPAASDCGDPFTPISRIQGRGEQSPLLGRQVTTEGIITLDVRADDGFGGFYLQQPDQEADSDPATSEALFIYTRLPGGRAGTRVRLTGQVQEFHGLTELIRVRDLQICGTAPLPEPVLLDLSSLTHPEALENMRVRLGAEAVIIDNRNLARYGELVLAPEDPVMPTEYLPPGPEAGALATHSGSYLLLDDANGARNPRPIPWLDQAGRLRAGDRVRNILGVLDYRFGHWRLQPEQAPEFIRANPPPPAPPRPAAQSLRVMTFNLANLFNGDGHGGGFPAPRGGRSAAEYRQQLEGIVQALTAPDPDIVTVSELENDGYGHHSAAADLARALGPHWHHVATPGQDGADQIRTLIYYRQDRVQPAGAPVRLHSGPFSGTGRPPLAQAFRRPGSDRAIRIVAVHFKSKSCRRASGRDRDQGDGQGCYAHQRTRAAQALADWLRGLSQPPVTGTLIAGDFNSYSREAPLQVLASQGYVNLLRRYHPCTPERCDHYTYRYRGRKGALDHILASSGLEDDLLGAHSWAINADEPRLPGNHGIYGSSDHNPVIVDLRF